MALRSNWEGYVRLNLISVPVKAYSATVSGRGRVGFHMLHSKCNSRIRYQKVCPIHGEVPNDEIVSGYEKAKNQYVVVPKDELQKLKPDADKTIDIDVFIAPKQLEPAYFTDRTYYLLPDGRVAHMSYAVLQRVMANENRYAIGTMVFSGREQVVALRAVDRLLVVSFLSYADQIKSPAAFLDELPSVKAPAKELELARGLVEASTTKHFDMAAYKDEYSGKLLKLIEQKAAHRGIKRSPEAEGEPAIVNLMDALRQSLKQVHGADRHSHREKQRGKSRSGKRSHRLAHKKAG